MARFPLRGALRAKALQSAGSSSLADRSGSCSGEAEGTSWVTQGGSGLVLRDSPVSEAIVGYSLPCRPQVPLYCLHPPVSAEDQIANDAGDCGMAVTQLWPWMQGPFYHLRGICML